MISRISELYETIKSNSIRIVRGDDFLPYLSPLQPYVGYGEEIVLGEASHTWSIVNGIFITFYYV